LHFFCWTLVKSTLPFLVCGADINVESFLPVGRKRRNLVSPHCRLYIRYLYIYTHMYACWNFPLHLLTVRTQTKKHSLWSVFFPKRGSNASWNSLDTCGQTTHWHHFDIKTAGRPGNSLLTQSCQISSVLMKSLIATT
jgi:hypothetical protein